MLILSLQDLVASFGNQEFENIFLNLFLPSCVKKRYLVMGRKKTI